MRMELRLQRACSETDPITMQRPSHRDDAIEYRGYVGTVEQHDSDGDLVGQVINTKGAITYRGRDIDELRSRMEEAIDSYLALCEEHAIEPEASPEAPSTDQRP